MAMSTTTGGMHRMGGRRGKYNIFSLLMAITIDIILNIL